MAGVVVGTLAEMAVPVAAVCAAVVVCRVKSRMDWGGGPDACAVRE